MHNLRRKTETWAHRVATAALVGTTLLSGCKWRSADTPPETQSAQVQGVGSDPITAERAVARLKPTEGSEVSGTVHFAQTDEGVRVSAVITGLDPDSVHGFHIHEKGDCSAPDASSAGGHYAPRRHAHGLPTAATRHAGDMGNLVVDGDGNVAFDRTFDTFSIQGDEAPIVGRAVIVHAQEDDGSQPTGNAGPRLACGVIEGLQAVGE